MSNFAIETDRLTKRYRDVVAVQSVNLRVRPGEIYGFLGLNGAGKTTTIKLMLGLIRPTAGTTNIFGMDSVSHSVEIRSRIGYLPQLFVLYPDLTVWENMNFAASLYGVPFLRTKRLNELLELVELRGDKHKLVRNISGGMQRRVALAWRKSFPRPQAIEALRQAILACDLPQVTKLPHAAMES